MRNESSCCVCELGNVIPEAANRLLQITDPVLFFVFLQSKPLIPLQKEEDPETHKTVLTNYMFPQQTRTEDCEYLVMQNLQLSRLM